MQAVILAAGQGKRLRPLTRARSKAMLPVAGKPMLARVLDSLRANGLTEFIIVTRPDNADIQEHFRDNDIRFVIQPQPLGMANALQSATPLITGDFVLSACDNLVSADDVARLLTAWRTPPYPSALLSLLPMTTEKLNQVGVVTLTGHTISGIVEKPALGTAPSNLASLPLYLFPQRFLSDVNQVTLSPRGEYELQDAIQQFINREGQVRGLVLAGRHTVTTADDLLAVNRHYLSREQSADCFASIDPTVRLIPPYAIAQTVTIGAQCRLGPNVCIEAGCQIGAGVTVREAVVLHGARIAAGAVIENQVVAKAVD